MNCGPAGNADACLVFLLLNQPIPWGWTTAERSEVKSAVNLRDCLCYGHSGPVSYRSARVKWAAYVSVCVCGDTEEACQTCPLSADGGMHNSVGRQFHAVSLPVSSLLPKTDKAEFGRSGDAGRVVFPHWTGSCLVHRKGGQTGDYGLPKNAWGGLCTEVRRLHIHVSLCML